MHVRFLAGTAGRPEALIGEAVRLARVGGIVVFQEPDMETVNCYPPDPAFVRLKAALIAAFAAVGADINIGRRLFGLLRDGGLHNVQYRPFLLGFRSTDPMSDYLPATTTSLRGTILGERLMGDRGGQRAAAMYSLIVTAKLNDVDPQTWLADVLGRIATHPASKIDELLPWNWPAGRVLHNKAA